MKVKELVNMLLKENQESEIKIANYDISKDSIINAHLDVWEISNGGDIDEGYLLLL